MQTHAKGWIRLAACLMLTLPVLGCATAANKAAICDGTKAARTDHAAALAQDGGDLSVVTGSHLIAMIDAGCGDAP